MVGDSVLTAPRTGHDRVPRSHAAELYRRTARGRRQTPQWRPHPAAFHPPLPWERNAEVRPDTAPATRIAKGRAPDPWPDAFGRNRTAWSRPPALPQMP